MTDAEALPDEVAELLRLRTEARSARDFERADALRDQIHGLGWDVVDSPAGSSARPAPVGAAAAAGYARREDLESLLDRPPTVAASVLLVAEDHPDDLVRCLRGLLANPPSIDSELVVVANAPSFDVDVALDGVAVGADVSVLRSRQRLGWADSRNLGLRRIRGAVGVLLDTSVEPVGDFLEPLLAAFDDPQVGVAGGWGVTSEDGRHFEAAPPGEVDAVEAYCIAVRREVLRDEGLFDHRFRFYRNADLDFSFQARAAGWHAIAVADLPLRQHEHRGWTSLPAEERDRLSRRNFYRFLKHWGKRPDLLLHSAPRLQGRG
jgi:cysteinyl-tRNA synthetase